MGSLREKGGEMGKCEVHSEIDAVCEGWNMNCVLEFRAAWHDPSRNKVQLGWRSVQIGVLRQMGLERGSGPVVQAVQWVR